MSGAPDNTEQKTVTNIYAMLTVSLLMSFVPMVSAAVLATIMFLGVMLYAYHVRSKAEPTSLATNHMSFIIRSIWIASFFALFTMSAACVYILSVYDPSAVQACADRMMSMSSEAAMMDAMKPCMDEFMSANMAYFINGIVIGAGPIVIYFVYRLAKGLSRALKGHRIGDVKNWF
ncbi:MAG: hypothetical protein H6867_00480 [Rhodospirillales bacterium]|nr:hypothetical protein [Rhodospirillales bacterium]MCB9996866.1 hypothetical protein [Rhodospirillales bacterium]